MVLYKRPTTERKPVHQKTSAPHREVTEAYMGQELPLLFSHYLV